MKKFTKEVGKELVKRFLTVPVEGHTTTYENYLMAVSLIDALPEEALYFVAVPEEEGDLVFCWNGKDNNAFNSILLFNGNMMQILMQNKTVSLDDCSSDLIFDTNHEMFLRMVDRIVAEG